MILYTLEEGTFLVKLSREVVTRYLSMAKGAPRPSPPSSRLNAPSGVFVTINSISNGERALRGCIGYPLPVMPLIEATTDAAISASTNDPRFSPIQPDELKEVVFEVSVLTPPMLLRPKSPSDYPRLIKVGRDGLMVERGYYKGLLLPQVPVEFGWDAETFLAECCMKAALPPDAWLTKGTKIYSFHAEIFAEESPEGPIAAKSLV